ncbi:MAG: DNA polymerase III subunit alpha [Collinsella sp.]
MAFVHLHNHTVFSMLDGATRIQDMVNRAVELGMPAVAITDHGYMYGVPDLALACDAVNHNTPEYKTWSHDKAFLEKDRRDELVEPDPEENPREHAQYVKDMAMWDEKGNIDELKPPLVIKPIFGCEVYFTPDETLARDHKPELYHMILLAKDQEGYVNLMQTVSEAAVQGFYYKPRVTLDNLRRHAKGMICTSACIAGIIPKYIDRGDMEGAIKWAETFRDTFDPGDFYIEIQEHGITTDNGLTDEQMDRTLIDIAKQVGVKVIATNDFHYLRREDAPVQDVIMCIGMNAKVDDPNRMRMTGSEFYMKTEEEMRAMFPYCPEACDNTLEIADKCYVELDWDSIILPRFPLLDPGETHESQFRRECEKGLRQHYGDDWATREIGGVNIKERFEYEYKVICDKGFAAYFLIVAEYVQWAKDNGIGVGPGRGSAAGAIVAYAMNITAFDPLENGLMFERFLSPQRTEMPDIDMDFDDERRLEVVEHVRQLYGPEKVTHVITYSTIKAKQAINDAARVLDYPVYMGQRLSKMVSSDPKVKLKQVLDKQPGKEDLFNPDFAEAYKKDDDARRIIDTALSIEGLTRGEGVHACAVLICRDPVNEHVPTKLDTKGGVEITQYEGHTVADMGLLKMDFLGLRTLTVISKAKANIKKNFGIDIKEEEIPFDDPEIFKLMGSGHTAGVFQVESAGMTATIKNMKPTEYKHVVALIALYRPGPLGAGMVSSYINRMNGKEPAVSYDDRLDDILGETYGTMVYQEQVMLISVEMCGFSKGESDSRIRKPVAKKKIKLLTSTVLHWEDGSDETTYDHWMNGAIKNNYTREVAQKIWDDVLEFASYAFNKSHSAGYAILVMQTAWLKAHYPHEYMAAVLTSYTGKTDKIVHYVSACRHDGIPVLTPDAVPGVCNVDLSNSRIDIVNNYHARMLSCAVIVASTPELELVQMGSFGCGHDAYLTDEIARMMGEMGSKVPMMIKLDESDVAGPMGIRVRSFIESVNRRRAEERAEGARVHAVHPLDDPYKVKYTKRDRHDKIALVPNTSHAFCRLMTAAMRNQGVRAEALDIGREDAIRLGKRYVHNDICCPAQIVIGEALAALKSGKYDPHDVAVVTGKYIGDCRLTHYMPLLRRALDDAGYDYVPVLTNDDVDAHNAHPGFKLGLGPSIQIAYGLPMIDALEAMLRRIRPYELEKGAADAAFDRALDEVIEGMERSGLRGQATGFKRALAIMDAVPYDRSNPHPTVLIVGEYLLNFHLGANHEIERYLEDNGLEVIEARMTDVIRKTYFYKHAQSREFHVDLSLPEKAWYATADNLFELAHDRCDRLGAASPLYEPPTRMPELVRASDKILHHTFDAGEGVLIPAEILEHAKRGCRNFVILQPFGCLPNHVVGRGLIHALKEQYPTAQFLPLDYDPDVSFANVENRLQMLIMNAKAQGCGEAHGETA